ncbi:beta-lactamase family protein [Pseudoalteromonas sp. C2R02]|uniref:serine hydrolase domain-containing protein n=1 Tax=Pseudoalteromonas sp. C2R02 TaxID=2841565 RepID=UPI001C08F1F3|nr:serine hydrolase domain-containing protein [Pseudoalteromonas sp. C2R02]MBU2969173.1 beta-lactamase family protein [Pseudoalteromonas sp. C2R02]
MNYLKSLSLSMLLLCFFVKSEDINDKTLQCYAEPSEPGIAVLVSKQGKVIYKHALGLADVSKTTSITTDSIFQIGSITKQFTAAAILLLEQQNKLSLSDTLSDFLPYYSKAGKNITLGKMLSHTSGLPNYLGNSETMLKAKKYAHIDMILTQLSKDPLIVEPGEQYAYSNTAYVFLGKVIEQVSGLSYAQFMQQNIFNPLNLKNTFVITTTESDPKIVKGYEKNKDGQIIDLMPVDRSWIAAAGAIASNLGDMHKWHLSLINGDLINAQNFKKMITPFKLNSGEAINYGLGFDIYPINHKKSISHQGSVPGFFSFSAYFPEQNVYGIALSNSNTHPGPALLHILSKGLKTLPDKVSVINPLDINKLVGQYDIGDGEVRTISFENNQLFSQKQGKEKYPLVLRENNAFSFECDSDYFQLITTDEGKVGLQRRSLYFGKGNISLKLL